MVNDRCVRSASQRRCTVTRTSRGWAVNEKEGSQTVHQTTYRDWHRVEIALAIFNLEHRRRATGFETSPVSRTPER
jgi:hypothetical protein